MSTVLVIPDIHQNLDAAERMLQRGDAAACERMVLLGDLFDRFQDTPQDTVAAARWLLQQKEKYGEKLVALIGNHDLPYLEACRAAGREGGLPLRFFPRNNCPGFHRLKAEALLKAVGPGFADLWKLHHREDGVLYTHAGANADQDARLDAEAPALLADPGQRHDFFQAGERLGLAGEPGMLWRDFAEFSAVPGLAQVFGHTPIPRRARVVAGNACIDANQSLYARVCDGATLHLHSADGAPFEVAEHGLDPHADARVVKGRVLYRPIHPLLRLRHDLSSYALALRQGTALNTISP